MAGLAPAVWPILSPVGLSVAPSRWL